MKIRIETAALTAPNISGVGHYIRMLTNNLADLSPKGTEVSAFYFNFLSKHRDPAISSRVRHEKHTLMPQRVFAKLQSYGVPLPFDLFSSPVDVTIFPNFVRWTTVKSHLSAVVIHDLGYLHFPDVIEERNLAHLRRVVPRSVAKSDIIITVSHAMKQEIMEFFAVPEEKIVVTPIPPDPIYLQHDHTIDIPKAYNLPTKKYIFSIGNLEPRKDLPTMIEAFCRLPKAIRQEYSLVLGGGKGWKSEKTEAAIQQAQAAGEHVIRPGYIQQEDLPCFFRQASLFCMSSIYEGFGMPVVEALACHTPVLCSDIPVLREAGGEAALYAEAQNPDDFAKQMEKIISTPDIRTKLPKKADAQLATISWQDNTDRLMAAFQRELSAR